MDRIAVTVGGEAGHDGAEQDGEESPGLDQRVAGRQLLAFEKIGQDAVFDRTEQSGKRAEHEYGDEQQAQRMKGETGYRDRRGADLDKLDALRDKRLVVAVGELAAEAGEKKERRDQRRAGKRDQHRRIGTGNREQDDEDQRGLEKIIAEGGEELAPEQRRETARGHQRHGHAFSPSGSRLAGLVAHAARFVPGGSLDVRLALGDAPAGSGFKSPMTGFYP